MATPRRQRPPVVTPQPFVSNAKLAAILIIVGESMLFVGLIGMYLVFRLSTENWPPPELPRLPVLVTTFNTLILFASVVPMHHALRAMRRNEVVRATRLAAITGLLGLFFLSVQGFEWVRLVRHGLTLEKGQYGGAFYVLIGCHGLHVLVAVLWVVAVTVLSERRRFSAAHHDGFEMCTIFWYFVSALWAGLFPLVYLY